MRISDWSSDVCSSDLFLRSIRPFVWRRSLDFSAIDQITDISRRIRDHYAQGQAFGPGYDLKRGRGGIREVEFFRSEEHTSELQSLMRISYAVFCLKKKTNKNQVQKQKHNQKS